MDFGLMFPDIRDKQETTLKQCQAVMLRMFKIFDFLCKKYNIKYFLTGGSLIGAVRHQGFIPWDDDLDIGMTRAEFDKFLELVVPELPNDIFFQSTDTDKYYPQLDFVDARLRDKYSSYTQIGTPNNKCHEGLMLDIFIYDRAFLPSNFLIITQNIVLKKIFGKKRASILKWLEKKFSWAFIYCSNYMQSYGFLKLGTYIRPDEFEELLRVKFEDSEALIPKGYDSYLKRQYNDYMKLPPVEKRKSPHNVIPDPFKPCEHSEILFWNDRK